MFSEEILPLKNKVITKIVYRLSTGKRSKGFNEIKWNTNHSKKIKDLKIEFENLMGELRKNFYTVKKKTPIYGR